MSLTESAENYASIQEVTDALLTLSPANKARVRYSAQLRSIGLVGASWEDLVSEATARMLSGARNWPRDIPFVAFMIQTVRSVASEEWSRSSKRKETLESDLVSDNEAEGTMLSDLAWDTLTPERIFNVRSILGEIESLFSNDLEALNIIHGLALGHSPEDIQKAANLGAVSYASAQRRIRRVLAKHFMTKR